MEVFFGIIIVYGLISILSGNGKPEDTSTNNRIDSKATNDLDRTRDIDLKAHWARKDQENNRH